MFDPFARAWKAYDNGGLEALTVIEAPLYVVTADPALAESVVAADNARDRNSSLQPGHLRWMILPDAKPVAAEHLNVVGGRTVPYTAASAAERHVMSELSAATCSHLERVIQPRPSTAEYRFGEQVPTLHRHVVARREPMDGLDWTQDRPLISVGERHAMRDRVAFADTPELPGVTTAELDQLVLDALTRFAVK
jgi:hypothetical protein